MRRALPHCLALLCGLMSALALGCGADRSNLIPADRAAAIKGQLAQIRQDVADGSCDGLSDKIDQVRSDANHLPPNVDKPLRSRINEGVRALASAAPDDCAAAAAARTATQPPDTQPTETQPTEPQTTETQTTTTPPETTTAPPETTTAPPETTTAPPPADTQPAPPDDNGGTPGEVPAP